MTYQALLITLLFLLVGCASADDQASDDQASDDQASMPANTEARPTFAEDVRFLQQHGQVQILEAPSGGRVALSAKYQGRVMTSTARPEGLSFGFVNRDFIAAGKTGTPFDNYGGEDRFWLGPEGGQYGLYFPPGSTFELENWQVPAAINEGTWRVVEQSDTSITFTRSMQVSNYQGASFQVDVERIVRLLSEEDVAAHFGVTLPEGTNWVGYESINTVTNAGAEAWTKEEGLPSIWVLGQFKPLGTSHVVIPYNEDATGPVVTDTYFGEVPQERLAVREEYILFKVDGEYRSKIGVGPKRATGVFGSYNAAAHLLTLIQYKAPEGEQSYVNSLWKKQEQPYSGDVVNAYNDGKLEFYELETSSPALALAPGESYTHVHRTLHLVADSAAALSPVAQDVLGISLSTVAQGLR